MIFKNTEVFNLEGAIRGMRNPLESWSKSDSKYIPVDSNFRPGHFKYGIGPNDLNLMKRLIKAGPEHRKFLRQIFITVDITAPMYWWAEFDTYKVNVNRNSTSMQHKGVSHVYTLDDFEVDPDLTGKYFNLDAWLTLLQQLNNLRNKYLETKDYSYFRAIRQIMPQSYKYTSTVTMNYENVWNMYQQRKSHRLKEWSEDFCDWAESLPYFKELFLS